MTDAELIRASREIINLSQQQFAQNINYSAAVIASWETGRRTPRPEAFRAILAAMVNRYIATAERLQLINERAAKSHQTAK
jgi:DNA-binding transcriptional regulator YiaG